MPRTIKVLKCIAPYYVPGEDAPKPCPNHVSYVKKRLCHTHYVRESVQKKQRNGLCKINGCKESRAILRIFQEKKIIEERPLIYCGVHRKIQVAHAAKHNIEVRKLKGKCAICHSNPAELCSVCKGK